MRVGLLTSSYPRFPGDYRGIFVKKLEESLRTAGVDVEIIEPPGYDVLKRGSGLIGNLKTSFAAKLIFPFYCMHFLWLAVTRARHCDLLHANWSLSGLFAVIGGRLARRGVLLTERSSLLINSSNPVVNGFLGWVVRRARRVVTISESARANLKKKFPEIEIGVIPNGVDADVFSPAGSTRGDRSVFRILTVGRITPRKRLDMLLRAVRGLAENSVDIDLTIVGSGEGQGELAAFVENNQALSGRIHFVGKKTQSEVANYMKHSDVFVLCSEGESGGNVILEAMSSGLAVVSTPVGWAVDYIEDGKNGLLSPVGDTHALQKRLQKLVSEPIFAAELARNARATIEERRLTWEGCAARYIDEYERVIGGARV